MAARGRPSAKEREREDAKALGPDRVPENQKREVYERVRRAVEAKGGVCTSHKVGSSTWDKQEQKVLEDGLRYYPHERHSNMLIYIRIAASLPKKTVRDVAHHLRYMQDAHRAKLDAASGMNPAKRHHPDPAAAAIAAMHEHQMAAMFAANAAGGMSAMHTLPGVPQSLAGPGGPGPHLKDDKVEENMAMISNIRENMVMGRFFDNHSLMIAFDKNVKEVTALLATLPFADMQKLPVQINPYFITGSLPPGMGPQQHQLPASPPHHPPGVPHGASPAPSGSVALPGGSNGSGNGDGTGNGPGIGNVEPVASVAGIELPQIVVAAARTTAPQDAVAQPSPPPPPPPPPQPPSSPFITPPTIARDTAQAQGPEPQFVPESTKVISTMKAATPEAAVGDDNALQPDLATMPAAEAPEPAAPAATVAVSKDLRENLAGADRVEGGPDVETNTDGGGTAPPRT